MENWERGKFEQEWSQAFQGAEGSAPKSAWTSIDLALTQAESGSMRKQVIWYQRLAAAAIIFALLIGMGAFYFNNDQITDERSNQLAQASKKDNSTETSNELKSSSSDGSSPQGQTASSTSVPSENKSSVSSLNENSASVNAKEWQTVSTLRMTESVKNESTPAPINRDAIRDRANAIAFVLPLEEPAALVKGKPREVTLWRKLPAFPASYMNVSSKKNEATKESLWASVGASAGSYDPNVNRSTALSSATTGAGALSSNGYSQSSNQGTAYSFGLSMGTALSERWVVQGGLNYLSQSLNYQSNLLALDPTNQKQAAVTDFVNRNVTGATYQITSPYEINSMNEIVSIPLQAGYRLVNRKFALQLNSGIATDLFIRNTLEDTSGQLNRVSESAGSNSPYRTLSWAGLLGSEFSYRFADRYRISLVPGLRYSFNSVLKSEYGSASNPLIMDVGFRFRYIFK